MATDARRIDIHYPIVKVRTPTMRGGATENVLTVITVDDAVWPIVSYNISGKDTDGLQHITLTFLGDVTVEHSK